MASTSVSASAAAETAASKKDVKYATLAIDHCFVPLAFETDWFESYLVSASSVGRRVTVTTADPRETAFLYQRLSVAIQR